MMTHTDQTTLDGVFSRLLRPIIADEIQHQLENFFSKMSRADTSAPNEDEALDIDEAAKYCKLKSKQTIYQNIRKIPHHKRFGRLYFYRADLDRYLKEGTTAKRK